MYVYMGKGVNRGKGLFYSKKGKDEFWSIIYRWGVYIYICVQIILFIYVNYNIYILLFVS